MKQFVCIYPISKHLDEYIHQFTSVNLPEFHWDFPLTLLTNSRASREFQRGGPDTPPLSRMLGMGQCFVLREMTRRGLVTNTFAFRHCFVPVARVRGLLITLGCDDLRDKQQPWDWSRLIHAFLVDQLGQDKATFHCDFDIPLQIVAEKSELWTRFVGTPDTDDICVDEDDAISFEGK